MQLQFWKKTKNKSRIPLHIVANPCKIEQKNLHTDFTHEFMLYQK